MTIMCTRHSPIHTFSNSGSIESMPCEYANVRWYQIQKIATNSMVMSPNLYHLESYHSDMS